MESIPFGIGLWIHGVYITCKIKADAFALVHGLCMLLQTEVPCFNVAWLFYYFYYDYCCCYYYYYYYYYYYADDVCDHVSMDLFPGILYISHSLFISLS